MFDSSDIHFNNDCDNQKLDHSSLIELINNKILKTNFKL